MFSSHTFRLQYHRTSMEQPLHATTKIGKQLSIVIWKMICGTASLIADRQASCSSLQQAIDDY
jgi:hypothetical protein